MVEFQPIVFRFFRRVGKMIMDFSLPVTKEKIIRAAYGFSSFTASIIHTVINIIYDCWMKYIAIFVDFIFEKVVKRNL